MKGKSLLWSEKGRKKERDMQPVTSQPLLSVDLDPVLFLELSAATVTQVEYSIFVNAMPPCFFALDEREYQTSRYDMNQPQAGTSKEFHLRSWNAVMRHRRKKLERF